MNYETAASKAEAQILKWGKGARCLIERGTPTRQPNGSIVTVWSPIASGVPVVDIGLRSGVGDGGVLVKRRTWLLSGKAIDAAGATIKSTDRIVYGGTAFNIRADGLNVTKPDPSGPTILVELGTLT